MYSIFSFIFLLLRSLLLLACDEVTKLTGYCLSQSTTGDNCYYVIFHSQEEHIKVIIALLEKYGRDPKVLDVLCSLCVGNGTAVRSSQNNICDYLLPGRNLLLQTQLVDHVSR